MGQPLPNPRRRALVVDDDEFVRRFIRDVLEGRGFEVYVAPDGSTAASMYAKHHDISLIVTDILMPRADGIDFILGIRRRSDAGSEQPMIIAISGGGSIQAEMYLENAEGLGANATLEKPFSVSDLTQALSRLGF